MLGHYKYDVFLSFDHKEESKIHVISKRLEDCGIEVFWSKMLPKGVDFVTEIENALKDSQHLVIFCFNKFPETKWVKNEWQIFYNLYHIKDPDYRRMYILCNNTCDIESIPATLKNINRPKSPDDLIPALFKAKSNDYKKTKKNLELQSRKFREAQKYYRYNRFWGTIAEKGDVHIFTCGRDIQYDPDSSRGEGGRTNIDMWDYRSVFDITHFFASNYPNTRIKIEDPVSKLPIKDLEDFPRLANRITTMTMMLEGKNCIIIGSPDVSDFAEIVLANIHDIDPYTTRGRVKKKGFVIIKDRMDTRSAVYWKKQGGEEEGVAQISEKKIHIFPHKKYQNDDEPGGMYGILIVTKNPFCKDGSDKKIIILSGFSGVATNAIAKLLTNEFYIDEFFRFDNEYLNVDHAIEALIGVKYNVGKSNESRDARSISDIYFERLVQI